MSLARSDRLPSYALEHPALLYRSLDEFLAYTVPFVRQGVADGEPVFGALGPTELDALRSAVKSNGAVHLEDTNEWHPVPATRLRAFHRFVTDALQRGAEHVRLIGEPLWLNGPPGSALEWARYESVLNDVLASFPVTLVCTFDRSRLRPEVVADAGRTHPAVWTNGATGPSADFEDPSSLLARWTPRLTPVPSDAASMPPPFDPAASRAFVRDRAALAGVAESRSPRPRSLRTRTTTVPGRPRSEPGRTAATSSVRSTTPGPAWPTRSPATAHPEPSSPRAAGCGSLARSSISCRSPPDPGGPRCASRCRSAPRIP